MKEGEEQTHSDGETNSSQSAPENSFLTWNYLGGGLNSSCYSFFRIYKLQDKPWNEDIIQAKTKYHLGFLVQYGAISTVQIKCTETFLFPGSSPNQALDQKFCFSPFLFLTLLYIKPGYLIE